MPLLHVYVDKLKDLKQYVINGLSYFIHMLVKVKKHACRMNKG